MARIELHVEVAAHSKGKPFYSAILVREYDGLPWPRLPVAGDVISLSGEVAEHADVDSVVLHLSGNADVYVTHNLGKSETAATEARRLVGSLLSNGFIYSGRANDTH